MSKNEYEKKQKIRLIKDILKRYKDSNKLDESAEQLYSILTEESKVKEILSDFKAIIHEENLNEFGALVEISKKVDALEAELMEA